MRRTHLTRRRSIILMCPDTPRRVMAQATAQVMAMAVTAKVMGMAAATPHQPIPMRGTIIARATPIAARSIHTARATMAGRAGGTTDPADRILKIGKTEGPHRAGLQILRSGARRNVERQRRG